MLIMNKTFKIIELFAKENSDIAVCPLYMYLASLQDQILAASSWPNIILIIGRLMCTCKMQSLNFFSEVLEYFHFL